MLTGKIRNIVNSIITPITRKVGTISPIAPLKNDVVEISESSKRWLKPLSEYIPQCFKGSSVSCHHDINGRNTSLRSAYNALTGGGKLTRCEKIDIEFGLPQMYRIDKEFASLPPLEKDCIVWRGRSENPIIKRWNEDFEIIDKAKIGDIIIPDKGYSYAGFRKELAQNWDSPSSGRGMMYKIRLPKGAKVSRNLEHGGEVIMPRNAEYKLISKNVNGNHIEVELEYLLPTKDNVSEIESLAKKFNIDLHD